MNSGRIRKVEQPDRATPTPLPSYILPIMANNLIDGSAVHTRRRQLFLSFVLLAAVGTSLVAVSGADGLFGGFLASLMFAIAIVDSKRYVIPNELTAAAMALALLRAGTIGTELDPHPVIWAMSRAAVTALFFLLLMFGYRRWRDREGLGFGDVKLSAVAGAWLGWVTILAVVELATLSALGAYVLNGYIRKRPIKATAFIPFGAFLAPAIWIGWLAEALLN
jgi:leader peptidase (prepilin peptidase) / N-methyltransferase